METQENSPASVADGFRMIDVGDKAVTVRTALAEGRIFLSPPVLQKVASKTLPKGDALALAEVAGIMAAKNTSQLIPLCHPLPLDAVKVSCQLESESSSVLVQAEARATAKTGVEMEALVAVQAALLTIYDLCKGTDPALTLGDIKLLRKEGGKQGLWLHPTTAESVPPKKESSTTVMLHGYRAAVVTISDRCSAGQAEDRSGELLLEHLREVEADVLRKAVVPDEVDAIRQLISNLVENDHADLILCTGGTGLSPRDRTPEALHSIWDRSIPGFGELLRSSGAQHTPFAYLSRSEAGVLGKTLIILLPGSTKAVTQGFQALLPLFKHAFQMIHGGHH